MSIQNKHQEHFEDLILTGDLSVLDFFNSEYEVSLKIDGSPAIIWGTNPATGNFFVGTKSVFNKVKIKINHSHSEIDANHEGNVAGILHACFDYLPRTETIYQGDFIGFGGMSEYTPNTITYQFPEVVEQNIIIAPHTCYYAESDLRDAVAMPDRSIWNDTETVKFVQPKASIFAGAEYFADLKEVSKFAKVMALGVEFATPKVAAQITKQLNACIREGKEVNPDDFENPNLISFWKLVKTIKEDALYLCRNDGPQAYINYNRIDSEGYVMTNEFGMFKLVNREVFAYANFNHRRFQCAG